MIINPTIDLTASVQCPCPLLTDKDCPYCQDGNGPICRACWEDTDAEEAAAFDQEDDREAFENDR